MNFQLCTISLLLFLNLCALKVEEAVQRRARPPEWTNEQRGVFFEDFRDQLQGDRPAGEEVGSRGQEAGAAEKKVGEVRWSDVIDAETLTSEVKRISNRLNVLLQRIGPFKSGGNLNCEREFAMLTTLFDVIAQHDDNPRWKRSAPIMRNLCYRASEACAESTKAAYEVATETLMVLQDLLSGTKPVDEQLEPAQFVAQTLLMQRMGEAVEEHIEPNLADEQTFRRAMNDLSREAQLVAMMARVIQHPESDYGEDEDFLNYAEDLFRASRAVVEAVDSNDYRAARTAVGRTTQSCSACHEDYRG